MAPGPSSSTITQTYDSSLGALCSGNLPAGKVKEVDGGESQLAKNHCALEAFLDLGFPFSTELYLHRFHFRGFAPFQMLVEGTSITEVIDVLSQPNAMPKWPVVLKYPVPAPMPESERHACVHACGESGVGFLRHVIAKACTTAPPTCALCRVCQR